MTTIQTFGQTFNTNEILRDAVLRALSRHLEEFEDEPSTWAEVIDCLDDEFGSNLVVEHVQGVPAGEHLLYPLATYGWDGGNAINSSQHNLTDLSLVHVCGGPCANIVRRTDPNYPGIAIHYAEGENALTIQLF